MPCTLLHTADLHLGKSFSMLPPERAEQRRADLLATLTRICRTAREHRVDLLCIAGDLFDRPSPATPLVAAVRSALAEAETTVLLVPGNHDPLEAKSPYLETHWPGNVHIARQPGWQLMPGNSCEIWALGYSRADAHYNLWQAFPGCGATAILVAHAACLGPGLAAGSGYYPFSPTDIPHSGYLALGHHHRAVQISPYPVAWYAGSPESLEATTQRPSALLVEVGDDSTTVTSVDVATRAHRQVTLDVTGLTVDNVWDRALAEADMNSLLSLVFTGVLHADEPLDFAALQAELSSRSFFAEVLTDELQVPVTASGEGVFGTVYEIALARMEALAAHDPLRKRLGRAAHYAALALEDTL